MKPTKTLHDLGQSLWLDNITRRLVNSGTLQRYRVLASFGQAGIAVDGLAAQLQNEGAASFVKSWNDLMACVESKSAAMQKAS
jgi:hypothetical protein